MVIVLISPSASDPLARTTVDALLDRGHDIRLLAPDAAEAALEWLAHVEPWPPCDLRGDARPALLIGVGAVILLERTLTASPRASRDFLKSADLRALLSDASRAGGFRMVRLSGDPRQTEGAPAAEWMRIRAGDIYGPGDPIVSRLLLMMRTLPAVPIVEGDPWRMQPVWYEDVAQAVARSVDLPDEAMWQDVTLAGPTIVSELDLYERLAPLIDRRPMRLPIPEFLAKHGAAFAQAVEGYAPALGAHLPFSDAPQPLNLEAACTLSRLFGIEPTRLEDGLARLVNDQLEQEPDEGVGALEMKRFWVDIRRPAFPAEELMQQFRVKLSQVMPVAFGVEPASPQTMLFRGATLTTSLPMRGHIQVRVEEATCRRVTLATLHGHPLAGIVRFESTPAADGGIHFEIVTCDRSANRFDWLLHTLGGARGQDANWVTVATNIVELARGEAPDGVRTDVRRLRGAAAARVEGEIARLIRARRCAEKSQPGARDRRTLAAR